MNYTEVERLYIDSIKILEEFQDYRLEFFGIAFDLYTSKMKNVLNPGSVSAIDISKQLDDYYVYMEGFKRKRAELEGRYLSIVQRIKDLNADPEDGVSQPMLEQAEAKLAEVISIKKYVKDLEDQVDKLKK